MSHKKSKANTKDAKQAVIAKLEAALAEFKTLLGEKKFRKSVKKASKLFVAKKPVQPVVRKKPAAVKKTTKKATPVKAAAATGKK